MQASRKLDSQCNPVIPHPERGTDEAETGLIDKLGLSNNEELYNSICLCLLSVIQSYTSTDVHITSRWTFVTPAPSLIKGRNGKTNPQVTSTIYVLQFALLFPLPNPSCWPAALSSRFVKFTNTWRGLSTTGEQGWFSVIIWRTDAGLYNLKINS